jgi:hypothetical protein
LINSKFKISDRKENAVQEESRRRGYDKIIQRGDEIAIIPIEWSC